MARPFKEEEDTRPKMIGVRVTVDEYNKIQSFAKKDYRTPSDLVRMAVLEYIKNNEKE